jgi:hypothetical protein
MIGTFFVDNIREVEWNDWAFERLVFSEDSKNMLLTLVQYHGVVKDIGRDIVKGKGTCVSVFLIVYLNLSQAMGLWHCSAGHLGQERR